MVVSDWCFDIDVNIWKMSGYVVINLYGVYYFGVNWLVFVWVNNVFDCDYEVVVDYVIVVINVFVGICYSLK